MLYGREFEPDRVSTRNRHKRSQSTLGKLTTLRKSTSKTSLIYAAWRWISRQEHRIEFVYPHGFMLRRVNNSGDISWHKGRVFISEVFRFEVLGFEQVDEDFYKVSFRDVEIGEFDAEALCFRLV
jgi:hypothetical protein